MYETHSLLMWENDMSFAWSSRNGIRSLKHNASRSVLVLNTYSALVCKLVFDSVWRIIEIDKFL